MRIHFNWQIIRRPIKDAELDGGARDATSECIQLCKHSRERTAQTLCLLVIYWPSEPNRRHALRLPSLMLRFQHHLSLTYELKKTMKLVKLSPSIKAFTIRPVYLYVEYGSTFNNHSILHVVMKRRDGDGTGASASRRRRSPSGHRNCHVKRRRG